MTDAISTALGGLQTAASKADDAVEAIVSARMPAPSMLAAAATPAPAAASPAANEKPAVINDTGNPAIIDQTQKMMEFRQAVEAYKASAKLLENVHAMQRELVKALGWMPQLESENGA
jgi:hypothetical protein